MAIGAARIGRGTEGGDTTAACTSNQTGAKPRMAAEAAGRKRDLYGRSLSWTSYGRGIPV